MNISPMQPLPLDEWEPTKVTIHLFAQIIGKVRMALMPRRNHWWHVPLYVSSRGLTTRSIPYAGGSFEISLDFIDHRLTITTSSGQHRHAALEGLSVATFYAAVFGFLGELGIQATIRAAPYDLPFSTPFAEDTEHAQYDAPFVRRFWDILVWADGVLCSFSGRFNGKTTPVHLFWHSFDLALTRFSGRPAPPMEGANMVAREAYSHEVISFGFWAGDANTREPAFYAYVWPEPAGLRETALEPAGAAWIEQRGGSLAVYPYHAALRTDDPASSVLDFLESSYQVCAARAGWDVESFRC